MVVALRLASRYEIRKYQIDGRKLNIAFSLVERDLHTKCKEFVELLLELDDMDVAVVVAGSVS